MELKNKVAVVTGAGSGIGRALAIGLAAVGTRAVVCTDLNGANAEETATMIGTGATSEVLDVSDESAIEQLVTDTENTFGSIDLFVSNAGYGQRGGLDLATGDWMRMTVPLSPDGQFSSSHARVSARNAFRSFIISLPIHPSVSRHNPARARPAPGSLPGNLSRQRTPASGRPLRYAG